MPLAEGVWLHRSFRHIEGFGLVDANGLVVRGDTGVLLVDTAWTPQQTKHLLEWVEAEMRLPVTDVVITHGHGDSSGGLSALPASTRVHALPETFAQIAAEGVRPANAVEVPPDQSVTLAGAPVEILFPGHGHAPDNLVVYLPEQAILFGGCFIKAATSRGLGNVADADLTSWPRAVAKTRERFPAARVVVPGHGEPGGPELLTHTERLLESR